ncbi:MAG: biopolymer transporter ExbD [Chitinophagaceae bacterium]|nr:biopolymer transporter ExbD [Chitinophagaceae bacterium]MBK8311351.1 biopolymer transporter ExbD [Chitinophagaceae bacterium]MBK8606065.1 biopolymer transporter ExbD [Chitinophagaceae bacterium]MBP7106996.1 biopolymer transporter ExbD [Chitinophagaceae bacterium]HQV56289.1 biopolymer transporter ExbD [Chitinophagaceae bacterium]
MNFRKKHREESAEVFTDSLNDILFILLMFFLIVATLANPNVVKVGLPKGTKDVKAKQNIMVSIDKDQQYYIGTTKIESVMFDSLLRMEIKKYKAFVDTPTVVINADTTAYYGEVFRIMRIAKKDTAKVVARID